jgi:hypothetical protein
MYLPNRDTCSSQFKHFGFKNHNSCESYWDKHAPKHHDHDSHHGNGGGNGGGTGSGYGGNNGGGIAVIVNGNGNVINIVINYFFGWRH